jgi:two-component system chemotaxis response regulator CheB
MANVIVVGASAGGVQALNALAAGLPADLPSPVLVVLHVGSDRSALPRLLAASGPLPAEHARHEQPMQAGRIHVAPPDHHMMLTGDTIRLNRGPKEHHTRPAVDPLFLSAALSHGPGVIGVVLTGMLDDGTFGLQAVKSCGGTAVVQDPRDAEQPSMPESALRHVDVDHCVPMGGMGTLLASLARTAHAARPSAAVESIQHEHALMLSEGNAMEHLVAVATPSPFVCPDCHGGLWEIADSSPPRFRCHTGHGFTMRTLQHALTDASDEAVWSALRALQERSRLVQRMIALHEAAGASDEARALAPVLEDLDRQSAQLRAIVEKAPSPIE